MLWTWGEQFQTCCFRRLILSSNIGQQTPIYLQHRLLAIRTYMATLARRFKRLPASSSPPPVALVQDLYHLFGDKQLAYGQSHATWNASTMAATCPRRWHRAGNHACRLAARLARACCLLGTTIHDIGRWDVATPGARR